jgi:hypothetical protein
VILTREMNICMEFFDVQMSFNRSKWCEGARNGWNCVEFVHVLVQQLGIFSSSIYEFTMFVVA